jgi:hypothetical protein
MNYNWMPLLGEFDVTDQEKRFLGKTIQYQDQPAPAIGNLISDQRFAGGTIEATVVVSGHGGSGKREGKSWWVK